MFLMEGIELEKRGKEEEIETGFSAVRSTELECLGFHSWIVASGNGEGRRVRPNVTARVSGDGLSLTLTIP